MCTVRLQSDHSLRPQKLPAQKKYCEACNLLFCVGILRMMHELFTRSNICYNMVIVQKNAA
uniref:PiggyBac transposable element-derived protein 4 C-terminal zinc-ribbon domain-containing protein n=1 Tax=Ascaris lumbricoides TaxID=6252 RepID=A0A0M3IFB4_ASCLU